jgi:hypothetical protein
MQPTVTHSRGSPLRGAALGVRQVRPTRNAPFEFPPENPGLRGSHRYVPGKAIRELSPGANGGIFARTARC